MRVGIDIDGVIINSTDMWTEVGLEFAKRNNIKVNLNTSCFSTRDMFGWGDENDVKFWKEYKDDYFKFALPDKKAVEGIRRLKENGHEIYFITARGDKNDLRFGTKEYFEEVTEKWVNEYLKPYDKLIVTGTTTKSKVCLDNNIDILIDDYSKNVIDVSCVIPVICFKRIYNESIKDVTHSNYKIFRTDDWNLINTIIEYRL